MKKFKFNMTRAEKCPIPLPEQLRHLAPQDASAVIEWFETYVNAEPISHAHKREKLREDDVQVIRFLAQCGIPTPMISDLLEISTATVYQILSERTWKYLPYVRPITISEHMQKDERAGIGIAPSET